MWEGEDGRKAYSDSLKGISVPKTDFSFDEVYTDVDYVINLLEGLSIEELEELSKTISIMLDNKGE